MLLRQALLVAILVSGTAAVVAAQTGEFPFRRFGPRDWARFRYDAHPYRFSLRDSDRFRAGVGRVRFRLQERGDELVNRMRLGDFYSRDMAMRMRNRAFTMRDELRRHQTEYRYRDTNRIRERIRDRMDGFGFERSFAMRRRSGSI